MPRFGSSRPSACAGAPGRCPPTRPRRSISGLQQAVATRQLIGQAQGILMERHKITGNRAFALLVRHSQQENIKLRELSERLVRSGELGRT